MILTALTAMMLFIAFVGIALGTYAAFFGFQTYRMWGRALSTEEQTKLEDRIHYVVLLASAAIILGVVALPIFYWTLQSYVPEIPGAMCIFGVTQVQPTLIHRLEVLHFFTLFLCPAWLVFNSVDAKTKFHPLMRRKLLLFLIIAIPLTVGAVGNLYLFFSYAKPPAGAVSCCTTVFDIPERVTAIVAESLLGPAYQMILTVLYYVVNGALMGIMGFMLWKDRFGRKFQAVAAALALINVPIVLLAIIETIGPMMMGLPHHHCIYCWWIYVMPTSWIVFAGFLFGIFGVWWAMGLEFLGKKGEAKEISSRTIKSLYTFALLCTLLSVGIVTVYAAVTGFFF